MNTGGGDAPPSNGGEFLLQLLRKSHHHNQTPAPHQIFSHDPAVAAVGPAIPNFPSNPAGDFAFRHWNHSSPPNFAPNNYFHQNPNFNLNPTFPGGFEYGLFSNAQSIRPAPPSENVRKFGLIGENSSGQRSIHQQDHNLVFGSLSREVLQSDGGNVEFERMVQRERFGGDNLGMDRRSNGLVAKPVEIDPITRLSSGNRGNHVHNGNQRAVVAPPPGFGSAINKAGHVYGVRTADDNVDKGKGYYGILDKNNMLGNQHGSPAPSAGGRLQSAPGFDIEERVIEVHGENGGNGEESRFGGRGKMSGDRERSDLDDLEEQLVESLGLEDDSGEKSDKKKSFRDKEYRSDKRGQWIMGQRMRNQKRHTVCRSDIGRHNAQFLAVFESLIPAEEERVKQKQLLTVLEKLVSKEWPEARLYLYGSCANSFGFPKSDIDVCLAMELGDIEKSEVLLKLADVFLSDNLQNVQALTRARVPIVKLMDPVTGISCDICINNVLAVVNTKLLRDYAQIDSRLRQLVFIVKHWAKSRGVNETYQGTLSSYAYVLMCIHFLQQRRPAILPCLQRMETTYFATVGAVECAYFDQVGKLSSFGSRNGESIAQLVWGFFHYWAYCHDYANDVISVRTGSTISKRDKDWTRRVGNDRHLICIEDPFEVSHDLGRVVDKYSIRVLREEFERAAHIMQYDPNPCVTLFEPYVAN